MIKSAGWGYTSRLGYDILFSMKAWVIAGIVSVVLIASGFLAGYDAGLRKNATPDPIGSKYSLLAKRTLINNPNDPLVNFTDLRKQLNDYFSKNNIHGSLYFEYLPTGTAVRINDDVRQEAASLLKIPVAMELYRSAELGKVQLDKPIALQPAWLDSSYGTLYQKGAGYKLTLRDAVKAMLEQSDSTALAMIHAQTDGRLPAENTVFNAVDVDYSQGDSMVLQVSPRSYSSLLKCLYFSCYLSHQDSQDVLNYLTQTPFKARIVAGISDKTIAVAHKVGIIGDTSQGDCGIVYLPGRNYILCMIINGPDDTYVDKYMADMSGIAYHYLKR